MKLTYNLERIIHPSKDLKQFVEAANGFKTCYRLAASELNKDKPWLYRIIARFHAWLITTQYTIDVKNEGRSTVTILFPNIEAQKGCKRVKEVVDVVALSIKTINNEDS